jgi:hypothetical protein
MVTYCKVFFKARQYGCAVLGARHMLAVGTRPCLAPDAVRN